MHQKVGKETYDCVKDGTQMQKQQNIIPSIGIALEEYLNKLTYLYQMDISVKWL